jgi:hypothetical protein
MAHVAHIIRDDDGSGELAQAFGGSYADVLAAAPDVPAELQLPKPFRLDVTKARDEEIVAAVGRLLEAYMNSLTFSQDERGCFNGTPYDVFLAKNGLPQKPKRGESAAAYARRLFAATGRLTSPQWVNNADRTFGIHEQAFVFGPTELNGLKIFFTGTGTKPAPAIVVASGGAGNCVACHTPPTFTDFEFHNTGATQEECDAIHGVDAFAALDVPS